MKRLSGIFRDTAMSPRQAVVYWTDYVLRHRGAPHLKPAVVGLTFYQRALLDALAFVVGTTVATVIIFYFSMKVLLYCCWSMKVYMTLGDKKIN